MGFFNVGKMFVYHFMCTLYHTEKKQWEINLRSQINERKPESSNCELKGIL